MKIESEIKNLKDQLDNIHDQIFSGQLTEEELVYLLKQLHSLLIEAEELKEINDHVNNTMIKILKILKIVVNLAPFLIMGLLALGLNTIVGIIFLGLSIAFQKRMLKAIKKEIDIEKETSEIIRQIINLIIDKKEVTEKKIQYLKRINTLKLSNMQEKELTDFLIPTKRIEKTRQRKLDEI